MIEMQRAASLVDAFQHLLDAFGRTRINFFADSSLI
jgi:hypothetical protein